MRRHIVEDSELVSVRSSRTQTLIKLLTCWPEEDIQWELDGTGQPEESQES